MLISRRSTSMILLAVVMILMTNTVTSISIVRHIPHIDLELEESVSNVVVRKAYNLIPGLKKLRAKSPAVGKDFVAAIVTGMSSELLGTGMIASTIVTFVNFFLSSLEHLIPLEIVEWLLGRKLVQQDVMNVEMVVRDCLQIYSAWSNQFR